MSDIVLVALVFWVPLAVAGGAWLLVFFYGGTGCS